MYSIFYYVPIYLVLAALGMSMANKKAEPVVRKQRWLKYFSYIVITGIVITSVFLHFFKVISLVIVFAGFVELLVITFDNKRNPFFPLLLYEFDCLRLYLFFLQFQNGDSTFYLFPGIHLRCVWANNRAIVWKKVIDSQN